jgi:hypothetical protein
VALFGGGREEEEGEGEEGEEEGEEEEGEEEEGKGEEEGEEEGEEVTSMLRDSSAKDKELDGDMGVKNPFFFISPSNFSETLSKK